MTLPPSTPRAIAAPVAAPALPEPTERALPRYVQIAMRMADLIDSGAFKAGQRLPSVRDTATQEGVAISTTVQAFRWLEERGLVQVRPKAGYFVAPRRRGLALPSVSKPPNRSLPVDRESRSGLILAQNPNGQGVSFGGAFPKDQTFFQDDRIRVALGRATRIHRRSLIEYDTSEGTLALRQAAARRALHLGCNLDADNIVITPSCTNAISLCLRAVTVPGDVVALESPTYFGFLDLLESLGLRALEIPTHPRTGLSLPALQLALDTQPVKALLAVPTLSNPLGAVMPLADKRALVAMLAQRGIPLIEDVIFNDLLATDARRKAAKAFDADGGVMVCGSFTKTLAPGVRLGWVDAGRWRDRVATLKRVHGDSTNIVLEHALADLLTQGGYEARLRRLSDSMRLRLAEARRLIAASFPRGTRVSNPPAGYTLWIELPSDVDSMQLHRLCTEQGIAFGPGALFTATDRFGSCLRLSFAGIWGERERQALCQVGRMATQMRQHAIHAQAGNDEDGVAVGGTAARSQAMLPLAAVA